MYDPKELTSHFPTFSYSTLPVTQCLLVAEILSGMLCVNIIVFISGKLLHHTFFAKKYLRR